MAKNRKNRKRGSGGEGGSGTNNGSTGSSVTSAPDIGTKRPLSSDSPDPGDRTESKRQRNGSSSSVVNDNVFESSGGQTVDEAADLAAAPNPAYDKPKLTRELMEQLEKFLQNDDFRIEGGGEEINGATLVMNTLLRRILPFFLSFIIDKISDAYKQKEPEIPVVNNMQGTEGGCAGNLQSLCTRLKFENDRLEQYSRRESLRIFGIPEVVGRKEQDKDLLDKVLKVLNDTGAKVVASDILVMHRVGKKSQGENQNIQHHENGAQNQSEKQGPRPIIVRFISRNKKSEIMSKKKNLKAKEGYDNTFIFEDITRLRAKLLYFVKNLPEVGRAWTREGQIYCRKKGPGNTILDEVIGPIENADDLFQHLGVNVTKENVELLGLQGFVFV